MMMMIMRSDYSQVGAKNNFKFQCYYFANGADGGSSTIILWQCVTVFMQRKGSTYVCLCTSTYSNTWAVPNFMWQYYPLVGKTGAICRWNLSERRITLKYIVKLYLTEGLGVYSPKLHDTKRPIYCSDLQPGFTSSLQDMQICSYKRKNV